MVGWYDPPQLLRTALDVAAATIIGSQADPRLLEALVTDANVPEPHDYTRDASGQPVEELWVDFVADSGDGWNPTYAIARAVAAERLRVVTPDAKTLELPRARVLVVGGDLVYPTPTRERYKTRFILPYRTALPHTDPPHPDFFAVPGNHDWYDGLVAFTRDFCQGRWVGGWRTQQRRSYFALQLPHGWWLLGADMQLDADMDEPQVAFFRSVAAKMRPRDQVILCNHYPHWTYAATYAKYSETLTEKNLTFLNAKVLGGRVRVFIAGHLHYYCRHAAPSGVQKITAGGGGAFLHPTHAPDLSRLADDFTLQASYPPPAVTRRLCFGNLAFLWRNRWFGLITGLLYALVSCSVHVDISRRPATAVLPALRDVTRAVLNQPGAAFLLLVLFGGIWLFTDTHVRWYRFVMGTVHGIVHVLAAFVLAWTVCRVLIADWGWRFGSIPFSLGGAACMVAGGWIAGSIIMGLYLLVSLNVFGRHSNEAFSSLRIEDWKSFLRLEIGRDGTLSIRALGIRDVPRNGDKDAAPSVELVDSVVIGASTTAADGAPT